MIRIESALLVSAEPAPPAVGTDGLAGLVAAAPKLNIVAVDPAQDCPGCWCKNGKPTATEPIRIARDSQWPQELVGTPTQTRLLSLREAACKDTVFRATVIEWSYPTEALAGATVARISAANHNSERLKAAHRLWREETRVYLADAGAFNNWALLDKLAAAAELPKPACGHR